MDGGHAVLVFRVEIPVGRLQHLFHDVEMIVLGRAMQQVVLAMPSAFNGRRKFLDEVFELCAEICAIIAVMFDQIFQPMMDWQLTVDREEGVVAVLLDLVMPKLCVIIHRQHIIVRRC